MKPLIEFLLKLICTIIMVILIGPMGLVSFILWDANYLANHINQIDRIWGWDIRKNK